MISTANMIHGNELHQHILNFCSKFISMKFKFNILLLVSLIVLLGSCSTVYNVFSDYERDINFQNFKTYKMSAMTTISLLAPAQLINKESREP